MRMFPFQTRRALALCALALLLPAAARAQSNDVRYPTPVYANEIEGSIAPRDIGDPRRTRHFYIFRGTEGDISVTLESAELNGSLDLFTAGTLRPLLKITLLGGPTAATRSVFLRTEETLVLRVEARATAEAVGTYRIRLGGTFAPAPAGLAEAPPVPEVSGGSGGGGRRVTSTGARIPEPPAPAAEARAEPTPTEAAGSGEERPAEAGAAEERPAAREAAPRAGRRSTTSRRRRGRAARARETTEPGGEAAVTSPPAEAGAAPETARAPRASSARNRARPPRRRAARPRAETTDTPPAEATAPAPEAPGQRLIIVTKDGETHERDMRTVRRVTVENNQIVVVGRDGRVTRHPLSGVARMAIEP